MQSDRYSDLRVVRVEHSEMVSDEYDIPEGWRCWSKMPPKLPQGDVIASNEAATIAAQHAGRVRIEDRRTERRPTEGDRLLRSAPGS